MPPRSSKPSASELVFINEYLSNSGNTKDAAHKAYPRNKHPDVYGSTLLKRPHVKEEIEKRQRKVAQTVEEKLGITKEYCASKLQHILNIHGDNYKAVNASVSELNKMFGHHAPIKQITAETSLAELNEITRDAENDLKRKYERDF